MVSSSVSQKGQALLIVILIMVVTLTIGLSVVTRSITNLRTSTDEEHSQRAFSAAEAGIQQTLKTGSAQTQSFSENQASFETNVEQAEVGQRRMLLNNGNPVPKDDGTDIMFSDYSMIGDRPNYTNPRRGRVTFYWGFSRDCSEAALDIVFIVRVGGNLETRHYAFDPCSARRSESKLSAPSGNGGRVNGVDLANSQTLNVTDGSGNYLPLVLVRVIPLYHNTTIGITTDFDLPAQGEIIESSGTAGETQRKLTLYRSYPKVPNEMFPAVIFWP